MENEKLTKAQQMLVDMIMDNLDKGYLWEKGWKGCGEMSYTGNDYKGQNALLLMLVAHKRGYTDNRWMTFNAMKKAGLSFKRVDGKCLGTDAGVPVEYFETYDRKTKKAFNRNVLVDMDLDEAKEYLRENVYTVRKYYNVFNCCLIEGVPAEKPVSREANENGRIDAFLEGWSDTECEIVYGGDRACYMTEADEIHLPERANFISDNEFYGTALHEVAHSTGAKKRLNRNIKNYFGSDPYAQEELIAEISSLFISQEFGTEITDAQMKNSAAYIDSWKQGINDNPDALLKAVSEAVRISRYLADKESKINANAESDGLIAA